MPLRQHNKGQFQDIVTKWVKFQDNFRTAVKFQEFQYNWEPCDIVHDNVVQSAKCRCWLVCLTSLVPFSTKHSSLINLYAVRSRNTRIGNWERHFFQSSYLSPLSFLSLHSQKKCLLFIWSLFSPSLPRRDRGRFPVAKAILSYWQPRKMRKCIWWQWFVPLIDLSQISSFERSTHNSLTPITGWDCERDGTWRATPWG